MMLLRRLSSSTLHPLGPGTEVTLRRDGSEGLEAPEGLDEHEVLSDTSATCRGHVLWINLLFSFY